ncbi:MAG: 4-alpha-glucanotransferase [Polyangiaceae bacterium]
MTHEPSHDSRASSHSTRAAAPRRAGFLERASGVLLHPTSLAGPFESGDLGPEAHAFVDFLAAAGVRWWQMLPIGPVGPGASPYASTSVFAGSPLLVSLQRLREDGLLDASDPALLPASPLTRRVDFASAIERRKRALTTAFERSQALPERRERLEAYSSKNAFWLDDYATFAALKSHFEGKPFFAWPADVRRRDADAIAAFRREHASEVLREKFVQARFSEDFHALAAYARSRGVSLMGDAPIYVAHDSAEVWAHPELFLLDKDGDPTVVAGVPPDAFSDEGQLWGNPLYDWAYHERTNFGFWIARIEHQVRYFDALRLDHFIGFSRYYAVERTAKDAKKGVFHDVPGNAMFEAVYKALGPIELVAEDLGVVTDAVKALRDHFRLPGMNILQFSFSPDAGAEPSRPHNYAAHSIVYTGTHDNDTAVGWVSTPPLDAAEEGKVRYAKERAFALEYLGLPSDASPRAFATELVRAAFRSHARTAIVPVQDLLGLGRDARMNRPGVAEGNWEFRLLPGELTDEVGRELRRLGELYGRHT